MLVLDRAGWHVARGLEVPANITLLHLPPYSPELNDIERLFRTIKHHGLPERTYPTFDALQEAVHAAFTRYEHAHCLKPEAHPGLAA